MSWQEFDDECRGCRPALMDVKTGKVMSDTHPVMVAILEHWRTTSQEFRQAWHRVTCKNSRDPQDLALVKPFIEKVTEITETVKEPEFNLEKPNAK